MRTITGLILAISLGVAPQISCEAQDKQTSTPKPATAKVTWRVIVPADTPSGSKLFIAGNIDEFGPWQPNAFELNPTTDGRYEASLDIPVGTRIEYKVTRGSWATVEKSSEGAEIKNRFATINGSQTIEIAVASWAIAKPKPSSSATGDLRWLEFPSQILQSPRRITVWLPPGYRDNPQVRYPVVYLLDGQNVFDNQRAAFGVEWQADETAKKLAQDSIPRPLGLVAIDNSKDRVDEYTPIPDSIADKIIGGRADDHLNFITSELKPWIDQEFRTLTGPESTAIIGSSLGGLFVLHALHKRPDVFGKGASMSPSLFWANQHMLEFFSKTDRNGTEPKQRLWVDMGTLEGKSPDGQSKAVEHTKKL
ncbi:MAG: alpha/beta hydrolase-fold protein, partial [Pirellula sp.]